MGQGKGPVKRYGLLLATVMDLFSAIIMSESMSHELGVTLV